MSDLKRVCYIGCFALLAASFISIEGVAEPSLDPFPNSCRIDGYDKAGLMALRAADYETDTNTLALNMLPCLGDPDPDLRDKFAYEGYVSLLRNNRLSDETIKIMRTELTGILSPEALDANGVKKPFAALVLAELARRDRLEPVFAPDERKQVIDAATNYMQGINDYRGYEAQTGWRHGVAHAADLLMQLSLNETLNASQNIQIRDAVRSQIIPGGATPGEVHFYIYGEPDRLARPILYLALKGAFSPEDWAAWMKELSDPAPFQDWSEVYRSQQGLAQLHNTKAFANAVYINAQNSQNPDVKALAAPALEVLRALP